MKVKLGDQSQLYGPDSDPALANSIQHKVFSALEKANLQVTPVYTGVRGPDVWFEIADDRIHEVDQFVQGLPEVGMTSFKEDGKYGNYLDIPLVFEKRQPRRRW